MNDVLTTDEVADLLQCTALTVEDMLRRGELPGVKFGRSWMCPRVALLEVLNQQAHQNIAIRLSPQPMNSPALAQRGRRRSTIPELG